MEEIAPTAAKDASPDFSGSGLNGAPDGIGIEIESLANLPDAKDYGEHEFYRGAFAASEIAYCLKQPSVKSAFCGLLAAKKAILKSGAARGPLESLNRVEITHDPEGKPAYPGALLSISQSNSSAVAVSLWSSRGGPASAGDAATTGRGPGPAAARRPGKFGTRLFVALVLVCLVFLFTFGLWKILHFAFH